MLFNAVPTVVGAFADPRRDAYDLVILGCIKEYFGVTEPRTYDALLATLRGGIAQDSAGYLH